MNKVSEKEFEVLVAENRFVTDIQLAIERAMDEAGLSQGDLARVLGLSEARVSQLLSDTGRNLQARTIARVAQALSLVPSLRLVDKATYAATRRVTKPVNKSGPFREWLVPLEENQANWWKAACNDDHELELEAA